MSERSQNSAVSLIGTISAAGAIAGLMMALLFSWADPRIRAHAAREMAEAVNDVLGEPARVERLYLHDAQLTKELPAGVDEVNADVVFAGYSESDQLIGFAVTTREPGFSELITIAFGYDPRTSSITGMKVLDSKETPVIADGILALPFRKQFEGRTTPLQGVKAGRNTGAPQQVDMISGATISSRAIIAAINKRVEAITPVLQAYLAKAGGA